MPDRLQKNLRNKFRSAYLSLSTEVLQKKIEEAEERLKNCSICPRNCKVDRYHSKTGFCKTGVLPFVASHGQHFGEEKPLVGRYGSGTIFFGRCNLRCMFCQNYSISHLGEGREISFESLADMMIELQGRGCHNINFVTPTHQMPMILRSLSMAREKGLSLPLVYNCGGYESLEPLKILNGVIDIYMPDFKYFDPQMGLKYSHVKDYPEVAMTAIKEMHRQVGDLVMNDDGIALRGLLVRHLVLPDNIAGSEGVIKFIAEEISKNAYINIMDQYYPCFKAYDDPRLKRRITRREYEDVIHYAISAGLQRIDGISV